MSAICEVNHIPSDNEADLNMIPVIKPLNIRTKRFIEMKEDESLEEFRSLVDRSVNENNPLSAEIGKLFNQYSKLLRRFNKILSLSDSYQTQLREFNARLEFMAHTDPLTGINNRGFFLELLDAELHRASRHKRKISMLMLDLDHFKLVNDTYGHAAGDEALRTFTQVMKASELRKSDFFGRIGGEEFAVTLPETGIQDAAKVAERIRASLGSTPVISKGKVFYITASIGVSEYQTGDTQDALLQRADQAMYQAKRTGRDKVCTSN